MFKIGDRVELICALHRGAEGVVTKILDGSGHSTPEYRVRRDHETGDGLWFHHHELKLLERVMETKKTFEVGKTYEYKGSLYTCLGVHLFRTDSVSGVMRYKPRDPIYQDDIGDIPHVYMWNDQWVEVVKPKMTKAVKYIYEGENLTHYSALGSEPTVDTIAKVEVTHTEGVGVEYKVLEYYPPKKG